MPFSPLRPLAALPLLIALGAVSAPASSAPWVALPHAAGPSDQKVPRQVKPRHGPPARTQTPHQRPGHPPGPAMPPAPMPHAPHLQMPAHPMGPGAAMAPHFHEVQRRAVETYFEAPEHQGYVPPGLAKKRSLPPGHVRLWQRGQPLPAGVVYYVLPRSLELVLGPPPPGHRYVRVAADILLLAVGTGIVVDALEDLVR